MKISKKITSSEFIEQLNRENDKINFEKGEYFLDKSDANYWYESGECHNVTISKNIFTNRILSKKSRKVWAFSSLASLDVEINPRGSTGGG